MNHALPDSVEVICDNGLEKSFRISASLPSASTSDVSACVLVNSGRVSSFDAQLPETALFQELRRKLFGVGIATFEVDLPAREDAIQPASEAHICARYNRLVRLLTHELFQPYCSNFTLVGLSLGGQVLLRHAKDNFCPSLAPHTSVMISTIIDEPTPVFANTKMFHLVYGSQDYIAYVCEGSREIAPIGPAEYGKESAKHLIVRRSQAVSVEILNGLGHVLVPTAEKSVDPVSWLQVLIANANRQCSCALT